MDEIHNVCFCVGNTMVVPLVEVMSNHIFKILTVDIVEMALKTVHESTSGLSNIYLICFASDTVN